MATFVRVCFKEKKVIVKNKWFLNRNLLFCLHSLPHALYVEMKLPQSNKVYFFHTHVLSALSEMEISPVQGSARHGEGSPGSEGGGGRKRSPSAARVPRQSTRSCFLRGRSNTPPPLPWHRQLQGRDRLSPLQRGSSKQVSQTGPGRNAELLYNAKCKGA